MPFKPRTNLTGTDNLNANSLRETLRHAGLHNSNDTEKQALFQTIDTLLLELARTTDLAKSLQAQVSNLNIIINNITNLASLSSSGMLGLDGLDGQDGQDSLVPGPQGPQGIQGLMGPPGIDGEDGEDFMYLVIP